MKKTRKKDHEFKREQKPRVALSREIKIHGTAACLALWKKRPQDVVRVYVREDVITVFSPLLKWAAEQRKAYHVVADEELARITDSLHHQGVCLLAKEVPMLTFAQLRKALTVDDAPQLLLYLDGVENPHNLGAILRSCAHFGVNYVIGAAGRLPALSPSAYRVAEGGAEFVRLVSLNEPVPQLRQLKELGFSLLATRATQAASVFKHRFEARSVLILGAEVEGVSAQVIKQADAILSIPGSGEVESLNVSVAGAIVMSEYVRQVMSVLRRE